MFEKIIDPKDPEIVLLGLILLSLGPLKIFPNIKPPISELIQASIKAKNKIFVSIKLIK